MSHSRPASFVRLWLGLLAVSAAGAAPFPPLTQVWSFPATGGFYSPPVLAGGRLFVGGVDGSVRALSADGQPIWSYPLGGQLYAGLAVDETTVYAASTEMMIVALARDSGAVRWRQALDGVVYAAPRRVGDALLVGTGDTGSVYCLDAASGEQRWRFPLGDRLGSGIAVADGRAYLPSYDAHLYAVELATGLLQWQFVAAGPLDSMPLVDGDRLYLKLADDTVYALARATGKVVWQRDGTGVRPAADEEPVNWSPLAVAEGRLLYGSVDGRIHALDAATGQPVWQTEATVARPAPPTIAGELGYAGGKDGTLVAVDLATGTTVWSWRPERPVTPAQLSGIMWPPVIDGARVYAASLDGHLYAFEGSMDPAAWAAAKAADPAAMTGSTLRPTAAELAAVKSFGARVRGFVVWESNRDGAWDVYRLETDGSGFRRLTQFAAKKDPQAFDGYLRPRVSPDGTQILFAYGRRRAPVESWLIPSAGGEARKVADGSPLNWLPDGSGFYLVRNSRVEQYRLADGNVTALNDLELPVTGADGGMVGGIRPDRKAGVFRTPQRNEYVDFGQRKTIRTLGGCEPQFTVDGRYLFWVNGPKDFRVIDLTDDGERQFLATPASEPYNYTYFPTVSADGRWVAYGASPGQHDHNTSDYEIYLQELRDWQPVGQPIRLSWHPATDRWPCLWIGR